MRIKVTMSMQKSDKALIDKRAKELNLTRSAYLRSIVYRDLTVKQKEKKRRVTDFV